MLSINLAFFVVGSLIGYLPNNEIKNLALNIIACTYFYFPSWLMIGTNLLLIIFTFHIHEKSINIFFHKYLHSPETKIEDNISLNKPNLIWFIAILIIFIGFLIRIISIEKISLWVDEIWHVYASFQGHADFRIERAFSVYKSSKLTTLIIYLETYFVNYNNIFWLRMPFVLIGTINIALAFWWGKIQKSKMFGIIFAWIMTWSPAMILHSRDIRYYILMIFFQLVILILYGLFLKKAKIRYLFYMIIVAYLAILSGPFYFLVIIPLLIIEYIAKHRHVLDLLAKHKKALITIGIGGLFIVFLLALNYSWIITKNRNFPYYFYLENIFIYELIFLLPILLNIKNIIKKQINILVMIAVCLSLISFMPLQIERYSLFVLPFIYLLTTYSIYDLLLILEERKKRFLSVIIIFLVIFLPIYNFQKFSQEEGSLQDKVSYIEQPNQITDIEKYVSSGKLVRAPYLIKSDYGQALAYVNSLPKRGRTIIIGGDPQTLRYYNEIYYPYNFLIVHPHTNFDRIMDIIGGYDYKCVYAIVDHDIYVNKNDKIDPRTIDFIMNKMTLEKEYNGIAIYKM